jgi:hypothetical protein
MRHAIVAFAFARVAQTAFLDFLKGPQVAAALQARGMEPQ